MASVIDLHIPDPPPVQNKTFPLKRSGLNTSIERAKGATTGLEDIVSSTRDGMCGLLRCHSPASGAQALTGLSVLIFHSRD